MKPEKRKRPVARTTGLVKCHYSIRGITTEKTCHLEDLREADYSANSISIADMLREVWTELQIPFAKGADI